MYLYDAGPGISCLILPNLLQDDLKILLCYFFFYAYKINLSIFSSKGDLFLWKHEGRLYVPE